MTSLPAGISAGELWAALSEVPRPFEVVEFPRAKANGDPVGHVAIVVLTAEEQFACSANAGRFTRSLIKDKETSPDAPDYRDIYSNQAALEVLVRACRDPKDIAKRVFPSPEELRKKLTGDELAVLFRHYLQVKSVKGPIVSSMSDDDVDAWIARLGEAGSVLPLGLLSSDVLEELTLRLASRLHKSSTVTTSAGEPPSSGAIESAVMGAEDGGIVDELNPHG